MPHRAKPGRPGAVVLALLLAGCGADFAPFGRETPPVPVSSLTVQRIGGDPVAPVDPLTPEPGNVWPAEERPRATLANPDAPNFRQEQDTPALERAARERGAPPQPRVLSAEPGPAVPPEAAPNPRAPAPGTYRRQGSVGAAPGVLDPMVVPPVARVNPGPPATPPARRQDGRVIPVPGGAPATTTGGTGAYQTYSTPGGGSGVAIPQGPTTTLIGPDGQVQVVPTPR